jgi:hypothetical protein
MLWVIVVVAVVFFAQSTAAVRLRILACFGVMLAFSVVCNAQMQKQRECADQVKKDIEKTRDHSPSVYATIRTYMFAYSKTRDTCVIVIQYRVQDKQNNLPEVQVLAMNAVTMQPMAGYREIYLIPASDEKQIMDATNFLFEKYSR